MANSYSSQQDEVLYMRSVLMDHLHECYYEASMRLFDDFITMSRAFRGTGLRISEYAVPAEDLQNSIYQQAIQKLYALYEMSDDEIREVYARTFKSAPG